MRLLLLYLAGCRAGDHDLFLDRAYWARRLPPHANGKWNRQRLWEVWEEVRVRRCKCSRRHWIRSRRSRPHRWRGRRTRHGSRRP